MGEGPPRPCRMAAALVWYVRATAPAHVPLWMAVLAIPLTGWGPTAAENSGGHRGPRHNGVLPATGLMKSWPDAGPKLLWEGKVHIPEYNISYSNTMIKDGRLIAFTQDRAVNPSSPGRLLMLDAETGEQMAALPSGAKGALLWADGMIYLLDDRPRMALIEPSKDALREASSFQPPLLTYGTGDSVQLFTPPVVAEGRLFLRDQPRVLVYDIRAR